MGLQPKPTQSVAANKMSLYNRGKYKMKGSLEFQGVDTRYKGGPCACPRAGQTTRVAHTPRNPEEPAIQTPTLPEVTPWKKVKAVKRPVSFSLEATVRLVRNQAFCRRLRGANR